MTRPTMPDEEKPSSEKVLEVLEAELTGPMHRTTKHPRHKELHMLTAAEERIYSKVRAKKGLKSKKYDGRVAKGNNTASLTQTKEVLNDFYASVKLPELKNALELSNDPRYGTLLSMLNNPRFNNTSFPELCKRSRMTLQDVIGAWRLHVQNQGLTRMFQHLPDIMEDVAIDSKSRWVICPKCLGEGKMMGMTYNSKKDPICSECNGDGKVRLLGDKDARNLTFELAGMRKSGGGINVNVAQQVNTGVKGLEDQIMDIDKIFDIKEISDGDTREEGIQTVIEETEETRESARELADKEGVYR